MGSNRAPWKAREGSAHPIAISQLPDWVFKGGGGGGLLHAFVISGAFWDQCKFPQYQMCAMRRILLSAGRVETFVFGGIRIWSPRVNRAQSASPAARVVQQLLGVHAFCM